jgi:hypothetical protein
MGEYGCERLQFRLRNLYTFNYLAAAGGGISHADVMAMGTPGKGTWEGCNGKQLND